MKTLIIILGVMLTTPGGLYAQSRMTEEEKEAALERHRAYVEELNLTDEQKPRVEEINMTFFEGISNLKTSGAPKLQKLKTLKALSATRDDEMKMVLTKEQFEVYRRNQQQQRENFKARRRNNR